MTARTPLFFCLVILFFSQAVTAWQSSIGFKRVAAPQGLTYTSVSPTYTKWTTITNNTPSWTGAAITSWSVSPALPTGLSLNTTTGVITGAPTVAPSSATYTVTAANNGGSATVNLNISVIISPYTWTGNGAPSKSWGLASNWYGNSLPLTTSTVFFDDVCGANCDADIDVAVDVQEIQLKSNYTGTLTQVTTNTITLGTNYADTIGGFIVQGGTFVGGTGNIRSDFLQLEAGTFTSTMGELRLGFNALHGVNSHLGFLLDAGAVFNHNTGTVYVDTETNSTSSRRGFSFDIDISLSLYNLELDAEDQTSDQDYDSTRVEINGTSPVINVMSDLKYRNGLISHGTIKFYGSTVSFYCDSSNSPDICSGQSRNGSFTGHHILEFCGSSPQVYWFEEGARAPGFLVNNSFGVNPAGPGSTLRGFGVDIQNGLFTAPPTLIFYDSYVFSGSNTAQAFTVGTFGSYAHNNGTLIVKAQTVVASTPDVLRFALTSNAVTLYNFYVDTLGDSDDNQPGYEQTRIHIPTGTTITVLNDLIVSNGGFTSTGASTAKLVIGGDYIRECADVPTHDCADADANVSKEFTSNGSNITISTGIENDCTGCTITINPGAGNTVTVNGRWFLNSSSADIVVTSGTLHLASGSEVTVGDDLVNNSAITCAGGAYIQVIDQITGTPGGGNNPACYSLLPADNIPNAVNWIDFSGTSSAQSLSGFYNALRVQLTPTHISGTPTYRYRVAGGPNAVWTTFTTASPPTITMIPGVSLEFSVTGTSGASGTITVSNQSNGGAVLDVMTATVP